MSPLQSPGNPKQITPIRVLAMVVGVIALAVFAPLVWVAATTGVGLLALGAILAAGFAAVQALPLLGQKLENRLLAARKKEARRNPIEQLQNDILRRAERLRAFSKALVIVGGKIESIRQMVAESRHRDPGHVLDQHQRALQRLQQFYTLNLGRLSQAKAALDEFGDTVKRKESEWVIACAIDEVTDLMDPQAGDNLIQDLLTDTALRTVQDRFNSIFAELDVQMSSMDAPTRSMLTDTNLNPMDALRLPETTTRGNRA
jgi:hypothetical protein